MEARHSDHANTSRYQPLRIPHQSHGSTILKNTTLPASPVALFESDRWSPMMTHHHAHRISSIALPVGGYHHLVVHLSQHAKGGFHL
jgi:hypothetical protein